MFKVAQPSGEKMIHKELRFVDGTLDFDAAMIFDEVNEKGIGPKELCLCETWSSTYSVLL